MPSRTDASSSVPVVLYVEDAAANVRLVERVLARSRPDVELISSGRGRQGLELARARQPDLILLDLHLPDASGEEVLRSLRSDPDTRGIPVVMISGEVVPEQVRRLQELGAADYLAKPFQLGELVQVINDTLPTPGAGFSCR